MAAPAITGTAQQGQILSISNGDWTNSPTSFERQWVRCDAAGANCVVVPSTTGPWYMLAAADVGATIRCWTTSYNSIGASAPVLSAQTGVVSTLAAAVPVNTTPPSITGIAQAGQVLTVSNGVWSGSPTSYLRQWLRCSPGTIAFLQSKSTPQVLEPTSIAFTNPVTVGSLLVAAVTWNSDTQTCSLTDSRGNTWVPIGAGQVGPGGAAAFKLQLFYVANAIAGTTTVTASLSGTTARAGLAIHEYAGVATANPLDVWRYDVSSSQSLHTTGLLTTTVANDLLFAASLEESEGNAGANYTLRERLGWDADVTEDQIAGAASQYAASFGVPSGDDAAMGFAAFKPGSAESCASISLATAATYAPTSTDVGKTIRADVTAVNATGSSVANRAAATAVVVPATAPPPPPPTGLLKWAPPALTNPITINITNSNARPTLSAGQDYIVNMPSTPITVTGGVMLNGGRNIRLIGGEIYNNNVSSGSAPTWEQIGLYFPNSTGTVHVEGLWIHGQGVGDGICMGGPLMTIQIQNCRIENQSPTKQPNVHPDSIQTWAGPKVLRMYQDTLIAYDGTIRTMQPHQFDVNTVTGWHFERQNWVHQSTLLNTYAIWDNIGSSSWWPEYHFDIWLKTNPNHVAASVNSVFREGNCWTCFNPPGYGPITGEAIKLGLRPEGDWVPASACGIGYVSPGYV